MANKPEVTVVVSFICFLWVLKIGFPLSGTSRRGEVLVFFPALPIFLPSLFKPDPEIFNPVRN